MNISRSIQAHLQKNIDNNKHVVLSGPRRSGKTNLLHDVASLNMDSLYLDCSSPKIQEILSSNDVARIQLILNNKHLILLDEGQSVKNILVILDQLEVLLPESIFVLAISSHERMNNTLLSMFLGNASILEMLPLSISEISKHSSWLEVEEKLNHFLVYGLLPETYLSDITHCKKSLNKTIKDDLLIDILNHSEIRFTDVLRKVLKYIALNITKDINFTVMARELEIARNTGEKYVGLLEDANLIFTLSSYTGQVSNEVQKSNKYYFYDNGIRNAVLGNFTDLVDRSDSQQLWENFCIVERMKYNLEQECNYNYYHWKTYDKAELDLIEEIDSGFNIWKFIWNQKRKTSFPKSFLTTYKTQQQKIITPGTLYQLIE